MIQVEFKEKKNKIISDESLKILNEISEVIIRTTFFLLPTRFLIDGVDFFYDKKRPDHSGWRDMPIFGWSTEILTIIENLPKKKKDKHFFTHEGYREILFEMQENNKVKLTYKGTKKVFIVDYDELLKAFLKFKKEVQKFLNEYVPQLKKHPIVGPWLANKTTFNEESYIPQ